MLQGERDYYESFRPPFVQNKRCEPKGRKIKALKIEGGDDVTDTPVRVKAENWDERNLYWTAVFEGQKHLLKRVSDGSGGHEYRI